VKGNKRVRDPDKLELSTKYQLIVAAEGNRWGGEHRGIRLRAKRHHNLAHWCGYAGVDKSHKLYGVEYNSLFIPEALEVHGGLTYSDYMEYDPNHRWWFGFDCAHAGDYSPGMFSLMSTAFLPLGEQTYRTLVYVKEQLMSLADQLADLSV
jgi:hypothetical protein